MTTKTNSDMRSKNINNLGKLPVWNLKDLYDSTKGKKISSDLNFIVRQQKSLKKNMKVK